MIRQRYSAVPILLVALLPIAMYGCGKKDEKALKTQVVAKVNGNEISVHQLNFQMQRLGQVNETQAKTASKQVLDRLIDQQLLVQKSLDAKLDRNPNVMQAIEAAKEEILSQAYIEQQMAAARKPTEQEISDFYTAHPELFEKRRVYKFQELAVQAGADRYAEIVAGIKPAKGLKDIADWLKSRNLQFSANGSVRPAEQLPLNLLPRLSQMKDGDVMAVQNQNSVNIVVLEASKEQPVDRANAKQVIEQYLLSQRRTEIAKKTVNGLHAAAKIEYVGAFANMKVAAPAANTAQPSPAVDGKPQAKPAGADQDHMNKGLSGL